MRLPKTRGGEVRLEKGLGFFFHRPRGARVRVRTPAGFRWFGSALGVTRSGESGGWEAKRGCLGRPRGQAGGGPRRPALGPTVTVLFRGRPKPSPGLGSGLWVPVCLRKLRLSTFHPSGEGPETAGTSLSGTCLERRLALPPVPWTLDPCRGCSLYRHLSGLKSCCHGLAPNGFYLLHTDGECIPCWKVVIWRLKVLNQQISVGEWNSNPLQSSCLENPMDGGAWWATVHGGRKESDTAEQLHFTSLHQYSKSRYWSVYTKWKCQSIVWLFATPWSVAHEATLSMGQEYWSGFPFPSPGDLPDPGIQPRSPALEADSLLSETPEKPPV